MAEDNTASQHDDNQAESDLGEAGKKALDAERRNAKAAARERDALAAKLKEHEDRDKSESQRLTERAETAEKAVAAAEARALRLEVAAEQGLTLAQAKRLVGVSRDELEADAKELLATFPAAPVVESETRTVVDSLDLGVRGQPARAGASNADAFAAAIEGGFTR